MTSIYFSLSEEAEDVIDKEAKFMALITIRIMFAAKISYCNLKVVRDLHVLGTKHAAATFVSCNILCCTSRQQNKSYQEET